MCVNASLVKAIALTLTLAPQPLSQAIFRRIYEQILEQGIATPAQIHSPPRLPSYEELHLVHDPEYVHLFSTCQLDDERVRRIGFGTAATRSPVMHGLAVNTAGGTHHAFPAHGSGYCILNDLAVTTEVLLAEGLVRRVLILDLDVHQGDGTAFIFRDRPDVFTLSVHSSSNFPTRKQRSTLDVALPDGTPDGPYLARVGDLLPRVLRDFAPDIVLYDAGVDPHAADALGRLALSDEGLARRERLVLDTCLGFDVPVAGYVGGGYDTDLDVLAGRHLHLHRAAAELWLQYGLE
ncbi:hypothetical protein VOLCADRAFT_105500 [Volvox carteri f. nagariensis]|uniref:Histone deacetylase domain-containing protein n=1 Tax=Volvox carteri f. nagariensis TaxID=3068 RepID=D8U193_VOLCA|nr:uncharacterized protein VOLCADRAFT_105500 [Volvox carteri f. nagariensis]EFJ46595.1 hypothetical protein VOLCADRAFT_105500 [Volvox carteri f. nagariensis]|eukprot:XP_002952452.1 hypothetical protein VOLCADRAFT_105500 [Volvox carteri f. nagariensis]